MSSNTVIVDDRSALVKYTGAWTQLGASTEFDSTTTCSSTQGTSASFTFNGSSVSVFGTVGATTPGAALSFSVDKGPAGSFTPPTNMTSVVHHQVLWASPALPEGPHTLVITQTKAPGACVIYLDYLMYKTTSESVTGPYFIDDDDARIKYSGGWTRAGAEYDFLHTTHGSVGVGTSFSFTFEGKAVSFYGDINNNALASVSIALDNGLPVAYIAPTQPTTVTSNNAFFKSGTLAAGTHTLVVSTENANPFWLDYLLVTPNSSPDVSASASASIPASASNATTALPSFSVPTLPGIPNVTGPATSAITPSASAFGPGNASAPSAMPTGAAIGTTAPSAVLGLAALALCLFGGRLGR